MTDAAHDPWSHSVEERLAELETAITVLETEAAVHDARIESLMEAVLELERKPETRRTAELQVARWANEWSDSDELASDFAKRIVGYVLAVALPQPPPEYCEQLEQEYKARWANPTFLYPAAHEAGK